MPPCITDAVTIVMNFTIFFSETWESIIFKPKLVFIPGNFFNFS